MIPLANSLERGNHFHAQAVVVEAGPLLDLLQGRNSGVSLGGQLLDINGDFSGHMNHFSTKGAIYL